MLRMRSLPRRERLRRCRLMLGSPCSQPIGNSAGSSTRKLGLLRSFSPGHFSSPTLHTSRDGLRCHPCRRHRGCVHCVEGERYSECCVSKAMEESAAWSVLFAGTSGSFGGFFAPLAERKK